MNIVDDDECTLNTDNCDINAACSNIPGSFTLHATLVSQEMEQLAQVQNEVFYAKAVLR